MSIELRIEGVPVAKGRARSVVRGKFATHYTPKKTRDAESEIVRQVKEQTGGYCFPASEALSITCLLYTSDAADE